MGSGWWVVVGWVVGRGVVVGVVWARQSEKMSHKCKKQESFLLSFDLVDRIADISTLYCRLPG